MCHVLVIEDEPMIAMLLENALEEAGATSFAFASTEQEAVQQALQHAPAVIASDVHLLEGTGPNAVQQIQAELGEVPVIFITGTPQDCRPCSPPAIVLTKPVNLAQLMTVFRQCAPI